MQKLPYDDIECQLYYRNLLRLIKSNVELDETISSRYIRELMGTEKCLLKPRKNNPSFDLDPIRYTRNYYTYKIGQETVDKVVNYYPISQIEKDRLIKSVSEWYKLDVGVMKHQLTFKNKLLYYARLYYFI
jgi:hypothetical protein